MAIESQIVNGTTIIIQQEDSLISIILAISALCLVIITAVGLWKTNKRTRESNEELKRSNNLLMLELKHKFEPQIGFSKLGIQYKTDKITADFTCIIHNYGKITLHEFTVYAMVVNKKHSTRSIIEKENEIKTKNNARRLGSFPPNVQSHDFMVTFKEPNHENISVILWFEFEIMNEKQEMIIFHTFKNLKHDGYDIIPHSKIQQIRNKESE